MLQLFDLIGVRPNVGLRELVVLICPKQPLELLRSLLRLELREERDDVPHEEPYERCVLGSDDLLCPVVEHDLDEVEPEAKELTDSHERIAHDERVDAPDAEVDARDDGQW